MGSVKEIGWSAGCRSHRKRTSSGSSALLGVSFFLLLLIPSQSIGQMEMWLDYFATFPAGRYWSYEVNPGMAKGLTNPVWFEPYISANATYQDQNWLSTEGNLETHYTFNTTLEDVFELRPWVGLNFIWPTFGEHLNLFYPLSQRAFRGSIFVVPIERDAGNETANAFSHVCQVPHQQRDAQRQGPIICSSCWKPTYRSTAKHARSLPTGKGTRQGSGTLWPRICVWNSSTY